MDFRILGPLEVRSDDRVLSLGGVKPRAVLAVLLLHANEAVSADRLALALWGEEAPAGAVKNVQVHVSRLRKALGDGEVVATTRAGYRVRVGRGELDAERFESLVEEGRRLLSDQRAQDAAAVLREALGLWRGPPLSEVADEPFAQVEIARLEEQRLTALEERIEADLAAGWHAPLVAEVQQLVAEYPTRERLAGQLMVALYRCGRQADALEAFSRVRRVLVEGVGIEPGPELRRLQEAVLHQDDLLLRRRDGSDLHSGIVELPRELDATTAPPLVGRDGELALLLERWREAMRGAGSLLAMTGVAGIGKSRLAAELGGEAHNNGATVLYVAAGDSRQVVRDAVRQTGTAVRPTLLVIDDVDAAEATVRAEFDKLKLAVMGVPALVLVLGRSDMPPVQAHATIALAPLGAGAVQAIALDYAPEWAREELPVTWLLQATGGIPRNVHELSRQWARREAARKVDASARRAAMERNELRSVQSELTGHLVQLEAAQQRTAVDIQDTPLTVCPFKGLAAFEADDSDFFFGRERLVAELVAHLVGAPLLGVIGPSGSGKSSVMRAGLLPAIAGGVLPRSEDWYQVLLRPGRYPVRALAAALARPEGHGRVVLAVDQFEETFTVCADERERAEFISTLVQAAQDPAGRYVVVLALRADYYGRCAAYPKLAGLLAANNVLVQSMQHDELRRAVKGPCQRAGLLMEPELVEELVADVEPEPGGLPLLSTALLELWQRREGRRLRHGAYAQTGGVRGAVARLAEDAYSQLDVPQQAIARRVLMRLVGIGVEGEDTIERRHVELDELEIDRDENVARVVALLTDRRLLTVDAGTVEVAHEALLREWPRLRNWIEDDRDGLRTQRGLSVAAQEWERLGRDDALLLRGSRLSEVLEWRDTRRSALNPSERAFLTASETARKRERVTRRRRIGLVLGAAATLILATVVAAIAALFLARDHAIAASRDLASQSAAAINTDPALAFTLAREALKRYNTAQAQDALRQATLSDRTTAVVQASTSRPLWVASPSSDGRSIVTSGNDGTVRLWRLGGVPIGRTLSSHPSPAFNAVLSPDGKLVASVTFDGEIAVTPVGGGDRKVLMRLPGKEFGISLAAAPDQLVVGTSTGAVWLVPTARGRPYVLGRHAAGTKVTDVGFTRDWTRIISGDDDGSAYIWNVTSGRSIRLRHQPSVYGATFSPDGRRVATADIDGRVLLWDSTTGAPLGRPLDVAVGQALDSVRFSADGRRVVTTSDDGAVRISDVISGQLLSEMPGGSAQFADFVPGSDAVVSAGTDGTLRVWKPLAVTTPRESGTIPSFSPDGTRVVSGGDEGSIHLWDLTNGSDRKLPGHHDVSTARFSPDGREIVSVSNDSSVRLYDVATGRSSRVPFPNFPKYAVAINHDGRIAVGGLNYPIVIENADGANRVELSGHTASVNALDFSPDGKELASASNDGTVRLWNLKTRRSERVIAVDPSQVRDVSYSHDGTKLVTAGGDGTVRIWGVHGGLPVVLVGHSGPVNTAEFNPRGDRVVSAGLDGTVRVWDAAGGDTLVILYRHRTSGLSGTGAAFSPDGRSVVSAGADGMRITPCEVCGSFADVLRLADARTGRTLDPSERQRLVNRGH